MTKVRLIQLMDANDTDASGNPTYAPPYDRPYDWTVSGRTGPNDTLRVVRHEPRPRRGEDVRRRDRAVEGLHRPDRGRRRRRDLLADRPDPAGARARTPGAHLDVPRRRVPDRLSGRARGRVPELLQARDRRSLLRLPGHRLRGEGDLQGSCS